MEGSELPVSNSRTKEEGRVAGRAAQGFNIPNNDNDNYVGYIMGNLVLPPKGIKDAESVGPCSQTFTVCLCQPSALEVAYGDPDQPEGILNPDTAQRFYLGPGDLFRVPPGNCYRLENHSKRSDCLLTWTIIRPSHVPTA
jgi:centromere protein C